nr:putative ORF1 [Marmot picobirnavirus]
MTRNQIEYAKLRETQRANAANESLTRTRDSTARDIGLRTLAETSRHNRAAESLDTRKVVETERSNAAKEAETNRSNIAREVETHRHQAATEAIDIGRAAVYAASQVEQARSDLAREAETKRHNMAMELKNLSPTVVTPTTLQTTSPSSQPSIDIDIHAAPTYSDDGWRGGGFSRSRGWGGTRGWGTRGSGFSGNRYTDRLDEPNT